MVVRKHRTCGHDRDNAVTGGRHENFNCVVERYMDPLNSDFANRFTVTNTVAAHPKDL